MRQKSNKRLFRFASGGLLGAAHVLLHLPCDVPYIYIYIYYDAYFAALALGRVRPRSSRGREQTVRRTSSSSLR